MIDNYELTLGGKKIPNITEVTINVETPKDNVGLQTEPTYALTIDVKRTASENAIVDLFKMASNDDGRKFMMDGEINFHSDDLKERYGLKIKKAFIAEWSLTNPADPASPIEESFQLRAGDVEFKAGGGGAKFLLENFK